PGLHRDLAQAHPPNASFGEQTLGRGQESGPGAAGPHGSRRRNLHLVLFMSPALVPSSTTLYSKTQCLNGQAMRHGSWPTVSSASASPTAVSNWAWRDSRT